MSIFCDIIAEFTHFKNRFMVVVIFITDTVHKNGFISVHP